MRRVLFVIKRDLGAHFRISRNRNESFGLKCKRAFWSLVYLGKGVKVALRAMRYEQLGSRVIYEGRECYVSNWAQSEYPNLTWDGGYKEYAPRAEILNVVDLREIAHRFSVIFEWYMGSWHALDVQERLDELRREG